MTNLRGTYVPVLDAAAPSSTRTTLLAVGQQVVRIVEEGSGRQRSMRGYRVADDPFTDAFGDHMVRVLPEADWQARSSTPTGQKTTQPDSRGRFGASARRDLHHALPNRGISSAVASPPHTRDQATEPPS